MDKDVDDDKYRKIGSVRRLFKEFNRDYYKPTVIDRGFAGEVNNYIKYKNEGDKDEKLSLEKHNIYSKSKAVEVYMGCDTENVIDTL